MDWIEITISTNTEGADIVSEALLRQGAVGTQIIDRADVPDPSKPNGFWELIDPKMIDEMPEDVQVKAWFESVEALRGLENCLKALPELTGMDLGTLAVSQQGVQEQDWSECWKQYYKPFRAGQHLVIKPSWENWNAAPGDLIIELDPGMAFGTGTHETTAMCVEMIEKHYHGGKVLDVGTGSGILAIAAARLGADSVLGVDIDGPGKRGKERPEPGNRYPPGRPGGGPGQRAMRVCRGQYPGRRHRPAGRAPQGSPDRQRHLRVQRHPEGAGAGRGGRADQERLPAL